MPVYTLARNLRVVARSVDPGDAAAVILYGEVSAPVELRDGTDVSVSVTVTSVDLMSAALTLDCYLLGSDDLFKWDTLERTGGGGTPVRLLFSATGPGNFSETVPSVGTRYVRLLYHINTAGGGSPPPLGSYFTLDATVRNGPETST